MFRVAMVIRACQWRSLVRRKRFLVSAHACPKDVQTDTPNHGRQPSAQVRDLVGIGTGEILRCWSGMAKGLGRVVGSLMLEHTIADMHQLAHDCTDDYHLGFAPRC